MKEAGQETLDLPQLLVHARPWWSMAAPRAGQEQPGSFWAPSTPLFPPPCQPGLPRKACLRLQPLTSVLGHKAQPVPRTPAQGLLGAEFGAGSQSEALTSQSSKAPVPWSLAGVPTAAVPLGLNIVPAVRGPWCGMA